MEKNKRTVIDIWSQDYKFLWDSITQEVSKLLKEKNLSIIIVSKNPEKGDSNE